MKIKVKEIGSVRTGPRFADVIVIHGGLRLDLGILCIEERIELAEHLKNVVDELLYNLPRSEE